MTDTIFPRWRISMIALFLGTELLWLTQGVQETHLIILTALLAIAVCFPNRHSIFRSFIFPPVIWVLVFSVTRLSNLFASHALTALHPAVCGLAFILAAVQIMRHGKSTLYQWSWPVAWLVGLGCLLALALGWPEIDDLWFLLLIVLAELARCTALIDLLK